MHATDLLQKMQALPPDKQQQVLDFIDFLLQRSKPAAGPQPPAFYGLWADLGIDLSADELDKARGEMWNGFPRQDLP